MKDGTDYRERTLAASHGVATSVASDDWGDEASEFQQWSVDPVAHGARLDKFLADRVSAFSRSHLQGLVETGRVRLDGREIRQSSKRLQAGQHVQVELVPTAQALAFTPQPMSLSIVYEDPELLVIDKPAGLVVHPGAGNWSGTLLNGLLAHHSGAALLPRAGIVHRLDKGTTGLMVVAKTLEACTALVRAIAAREVRREYLALCHGELRRPVEVFDGSIGRDPRSRLRMAVLGSGKPARTDVRLMAYSPALRISAAACRLHTGRTHQIRVHLSHAGTPLLSDGLYGGADALGLQRPALHAYRLGFEHPLSHQPLAFTAALPPDLASAWAATGAGTELPDADEAWGG